MKVKFVNILMALMSDKCVCSQQECNKYPKYPKGTTLAEPFLPLLVHQKWHDTGLTLLALGISNVEHKANIIV